MTGRRDVEVDEDLDGTDDELLAWFADMGDELEGRA